MCINVFVQTEYLQSGFMETAFPSLLVTVAPILHCQKRSTRMMKIMKYEVRMDGFQDQLLFQNNIIPIYEADSKVGRQN